MSDYKSINSRFCLNAGRSVTKKLSAKCDCGVAIEATPAMFQIKWRFHFKKAHPGEKIRDPTGCYCEANDVPSGMSFTLTKDSVECKVTSKLNAEKMVKTSESASVYKHLFIR